ncbi:hypothetical protein CVT25_009737 [Psilocybe cyanescens]|uniref:3-hydroxy-3-methylglutaryl coenzyme A reductase n=1 Tax=Psilocybe cyanescens TaxID=93625 RepID=A0A409XTL1_PSICY|nr:hypothetical protein CVT25_009737 [Psilocybe cyanescens]
MRALFRPFALHAAYTPIETIVFFCIIGTLAYFHVLSAIKHSAFIDPEHTVYAAPTLKPAYALWRVGEWVGVREGTWSYAAKTNRKGEDVVLEVQQLIVTLDGQPSRARHSESSPEYQSISLSQAPLSASTLNLTQYLTNSFQTPSGRTYTALCHRTLLSQLNGSAGEDAHADTPAETGPCFSFQQAGSRSFVQTLSFKPGMRDAFISALVGDEAAHHHAAGHHNSHQYHHGISHAITATSATPRTFTDESGVKFEVDAGKLSPDNLPIGQMRNGKWVAYAARSLVVRFWDLAKKADSLDILLILAGYILMHTTFYLLLTRSRALGSSFWLPLAILSSAVLALLISLPIAMALKIPIDPVALTEALPFLVCTVGFDKPLRLARAVFLHPHLSVPPSLVAASSTASGYPVLSSTNATLAPPPALASSASAGSSAASMTLKPAPRIITESLTLVYAPIIRDYVLEVAVLTVGAYSKVGGLKEVCALAALILAVDCLLLCTYLAAILGVMVEVRRIKNVRAMTRSRSNSISSNTSSIGTQGSTTPRLQSAMARPAAPPAPKSFREKVKLVLLGEKGSGLPEYGFGYAYAAGKGQKAQKSRVKPKGKGAEVAKQENPVARLKLLLSTCLFEVHFGTQIASFMTLHILNLITPLTPSRHNSSSALHGQVAVRKVDITAPGLRTVLNSLVEASSADLFDGAVDGNPKDLLVKVSPPVYLRVVLPASLGGSKSSSLSTRKLFSPSSASVPPVDSITHAHPSRKTTSEMVEAFMTSWTRLVGDPILSKWIVIILAISVALNGYLLKGIAAGVVGTRIGAFGLKSGVRFEDEHEAEHEAEAEADAHREGVSVRVTAPPAVQEETPRVLRRESSALSLAAQAVGTFSLEDVDKRLENERKYAARRLTITSSSSSTVRRASVAAPAASAVPASVSKPASLPRPIVINGQPTPPYSSSSASDSSSSVDNSVEGVRSLAECVDVFENGPRPISESLALLNDEEIIMLAQNGKIAAYALEKVLGMSELERAVRIRRALISRASITQTLESSDIPLVNYDYSRVLGACCENVVGYIPLPLGIAGPLNVDGTLYPVPMATAEGTLVASTSRGCKALNAGGGVTTVLIKDGMTRGPAIDFPSIVMAADAKLWIDSEDGYATIKEAFESTSRFAKLKSLKTAMAGRTLFVRFATATGDAMGMNMISKGTEKALEVMQQHYPEMVVLALSGNYCTDKKPAAINWIEGRGKSVVAEAVIPGRIVTTVLKTTVAALVNLNTKKNLVGSAMAGSIGGFNAHAANILTAIFLATGQDPAQNVESSMCMTLMEAINDGKDLLMTVSMPCIEVGTVGGGTVLGPQQGVLDMLGMKGAHPTHPGHNAQGLARLIAASVMAGELSLLSALAAGHLIRAHMAHNRSQTNTPAVSIPSTPALERGSPILRAQLQLAPAGVSPIVDTSEREAKKQTAKPVSPSSSTASLPPYSQ